MSRVRGGIEGKASAPHRFGGFKHAVALAMLVLAVAATTRLEVDSYR